MSFGKSISLFSKNLTTASRGGVFLRASTEPLWFFCQAKKGEFRESILMGFKLIVFSSADSAVLQVDTKLLVILRSL